MIKASSRVLLVYPPNQLMDIETPRPDGSLGPIYLAAALESRGIEADILDASVGSSSHSLKDTFYRSVRQENGLTRIGMNFKEIAEYVSKNNYSVVGISSNFTPQTRMAFETARAIKESNPEIRVYAGGVNTSALKERFLQTGYFDAVCLTEGELIFPRVIIGEQNVPGIATPYSTIPPNASCFPKSLDDLPMPAWEKLPFEKYDSIASPHGVDVTNKSGRYAPMMTSRGCRFSCKYCHISTEKDGIRGEIGKLRTHSIERVVEEACKLKRMGVKKIFMEDDTLLAGKKRMNEIFRRFSDMGMSIANVNGVNLIDFYNPSAGEWEIDVEFIHTLKRAGFDQLVFPAESGSQRILRKYASNKVNLERMNLPRLMGSLTEAGIQAPVNIMIGFPDETEEEVQLSVGLARKLKDSGAPYVTFFIPIPFPGSKLYDIAINGNHLDRNFDTDLMNWKRAVMKNTVIPPQRLEEIRDNANELANTQEHIRVRLNQSIGHRWSS